MNYFSEIPEGQAIICSNGVYYQCKIGVRGGRIYAQRGRGYVRLHAGGTTSNPKVQWYEIDAGDGTYKEVGSAVNYFPPMRAAE